MKCIQCGVDSRYRERSTGRCPSCHHSFAFEPKQGAPMTDMAFQAAIDAVSAGRRVRWGVEHLYYEVWRRLGRKRRTGAPLVVAFVLAGVAGGLAFLIAGFAAQQAGRSNPVLAGAVVGALAAGGVLLGFFVWSRAHPLPEARFREMWGRWTSAHGQPEGVIVRKQPATKRRAAEPDLADYSFDRAVICDRARTVDLLLANNFHFENNCAVLAIGGYPAGPFETVRAMLRRNPRLQVFALHDATVEGCRMAHRLAQDPQWFGGKIRVVDVGLRPEHARPFSGLLLPAEHGPVLAGGGLSEAEARWLSRHRLELAAIRPEQVLKRLFRAINGKREPARADRDKRWEVEYDNDSFASDAGSSEASVDSFG